MAADMFMKVEGPDLAGESIDGAHGGDVEIISWAYGMSQEDSSSEGTGSSVGKTLYDSVDVVKFADKSSAGLSKYCSSGEHFDKVTIYTRKAGGAEPLEYYILNLEHVLITNFQVDAGEDGRVRESLSMKCGKFKVQYQAQDSQGVADGGQITYGWDITANQEWS